MTNNEIVAELEKIVLMVDSLRAHVMQNNKPTLSVVKHAKIINFINCDETKQKEELLHVKHGTLRRRTDGRWEVRATMAGKRITTALTTTQKACVDKHNAWLLANKIETVVVKCIEPAYSENITIFEWLDNWLDIKKSLIKLESWKSIEICVRIHIKPNMLNKQLKNIKVYDCQKCLTSISSTRMQEYAYNSLFEALKTAVQYELLNRNPCEAVKIKKHVRQRGNALTHAQQDELLKILTTRRMKAIYIFYILTGCRPAEALRAKWEHIKTDTSTFVIDGTKTEQSCRVIPLFEPLKQLLEDIPHTSEYIFDFSKSTLVRDLAELLQTLSFSFTMKDLRHTFATRCMENGIPINVVQKWLGHTSIKTTEKIYVHVLSDFEKKESNKFNPFDYT